MTLDNLAHVATVGISEKQRTAQALFRYGRSCKSFQTEYSWKRTAKATVNYKNAEGTIFERNH